MFGQKNSRPREVPPTQAEKFLRGIEDDPKFQRFETRLSLSQAITNGFQERALLSVAIVTSRQRFRRYKTNLYFAIVIGVGFVALELAVHAYYAVLLSALLTIVICTIVSLLLKSQRSRIEQLRTTRDDLEEGIRKAQEHVRQIDEFAARSVRIIDPSTFGQTVNKKEA